MTAPLTLGQVRAWFAEDLRVVAHLRSPALVDAFRQIPREQFLGPGPWTILGAEPAAARPTDNDDPRHVYHNVSIAIDLDRTLVNGQPGVLGAWLDALAITPGERVLHIGCGTGYYAAIAAALTGPAGHVLAMEIDESLASRARANLGAWPWIEVVQGDGRSNLPSDCDVILVNAGATHVLDAWLDATRRGGRLLVPLTVAMPGMPANIGKGVVEILARGADGWSARSAGMVTIYSLVGARDDAMNATLGRALMSGPRLDVTRLRRDPHERTETCWCHGTTTCLSR